MNYYHATSECNFSLKTLYEVDCSCGVRQDYTQMDDFWGGAGRAWAHWRPHWLLHYEALPVHMQ
jgi:hypothetical protein